MVRALNLRWRLERGRATEGVMGNRLLDAVERITHSPMANRTNADHPTPHNRVRFEVGIDDHELSNVISAEIDAKAPSANTNATCLRMAADSRNSGRKIPFPLS